MPAPYDYGPQHNPQPFMYPRDSVMSSDASLPIVDDHYYSQSPSPYGMSPDAARSVSAAWQSRQQQGSAIRRYPTRRINLVKGTVLSVEYPVPSAIRNAIEPKYRDEPGGNPEEFTHLRCKRLMRAS